MNCQYIADAAAYSLFAYTIDSSEMPYKPDGGNLV